MPSFNDILLRWQPFFNAVAGIAATLAGLLFVALSLNRDKITGPENHLLLRVARRTFGDLIFALFIALLFLMPAYQPSTLAVPLLIPATFRLFWLIHSLWHSSKKNPEIRKGAGGFREHLLSGLSLLGIVAASIQVYRGSFGAIFLVVPVTALLLYNACRNAWLLLMMEKTANLPK